MNRKTDQSFQPDYAVVPGETLKETLETIGMSQAELAERTGNSRSGFDLLKDRTSNPKG
jgi:HTH-type transcriptional regulator / antitoxin HigA